MFKLNLKIACRNLLKHKSYALISIAGLSVAFAISILAMLYANYERRYDRWNPGFEHIYRVNYTAPGEDVALSPGNMATVAKEKIAGVEASTRMQDYWYGDMLLKTDEKSLYVNEVMLADSNFFKVFNYPALYGQTDDALNNSQSVVLSKTFSELLFGKAVNPVGKQITLDNKQGFIIAAVVDVARYPSHFKFNLIRRFKKSVSDEYYSNNYYTYVRLHGQANLQQTTAIFNQTRKELLSAERSKMSAAEQVSFQQFIDGNVLYLQPVKAIHLTKTQVEYEFPNNGLGSYLYMMLVVALLVLVIAGLNFTNLSVTMAIKRAKETGVRKVLGAGKMQIGLQFFVEIALQCILSLSIALVLTEICLPYFNQLVGRSMVLDNFMDYQPILLQLLLIVLVVALFVGLYPALLLSNIMPAKILKGNFSNSNKGAWLRNTLVVIQFSIAVLFIAGIWVINRQLNYMQQKDLGYRPQQVMAITMMQDLSSEHFHKIKNTLSAISGVRAVSRVDHIPGEDMGGNQYGYKGQTYSSNFISIDVDYFKTMGMQLKAGRAFDASVASDTTSSLVLSATAAKAFQLQDPVGKMLKFHEKDYQVIGVVNDFHHYSPEKSYQPIVFQFIDGNPLRYVIINIDPAQAAGTRASIEQAWLNLEPEFPIKYSFLDQRFQTLLTSQSQLKSLISLLSIITITLALMGLFAIAAFSTQRRSKEISVRKVLGASFFAILRLLNTGFVRLVLLANILAWPIAYLVLTHWLNGFAFRIAMPLWPFVFSGLFTLLLSIIVVSLQSYKTAKANPVHYLKYE
jgi:putative ABC transport system permease protein